MENTKKMLVADLDGTLMFRKEGVPYFNLEDIQAIERFRGEGNLMVVNSGRSLSWLIPPLEEKLPWDYLIAGSGSCVLDRNGELIYEQPLAIESMSTILRDYPTDVEITFYSKQWVFTLNQTKEHSLPVKKLANMSEISGETLYGMSLHFETPADASVFANWLEGQNRSDVEAFVNTKDVDIVKKGCSKGIAMGWLCKSLELSDNDLYAIGDSYNDITMLEAAGHPFTFNNADKEMKMYAKNCVDSVAEMIEGLGIQTH